MNARTPAVLLISPGILRWTDMDFGLPHLVSMGGWVRQETGVRVEILDLNYEGGDHKSLARRIESLGPFLLVGVSCYSSFDYRRVMALAAFLKRLLPDVPLVTGGYHASALPDDVVFEGSPFDAVFVGEGERPLADMVTKLLGGERIEQRIWGPDVVPHLDDLPPYAWDLLDRYWPHATQIGRKFQIYLSRGCTYHCTFCMERSKSGYAWRAYSPDRAVDELRRLAARTDLSHWVINLADPLFGFQRRWRREVLEGIIRHRLFPRQYWTLTRSDDLDETDVSLLARARFAIGIGLESGSPHMLGIMQKGNSPDRYLGAIQRLARLSREHGLNWATNVIVGHPGETPVSLRETHAFLTDLFTSAGETCGWLSIDPFRLYPGSAVAEQQATWQAEHGAVFHHPRWWESWYEGPIQAQHLEPSGTLDYETRVRFMIDAYGPLVREIERRFRGQGTSVDRIYARSLAEQRNNLSPANRDRLIAWGRTARSGDPAPHVGSLGVPVGLNVRDPWVRGREEAVRRLLDAGVLRDEALTEALLVEPPERHLDPDDARSFMAGRDVGSPREGAAPPVLRVDLLAMSLEALEPGLGDRVAVLGDGSGYTTAVLARLVGEEGEVRRVAGNPTVLPEGTWDRIWIGGALPRAPRGLDQALEPDGRCVAFLGPRFRDQDLVVVTPGERAERAMARVRVPVLAGRGGWLRAPVGGAPAPRGVTVRHAPAVSLAFHVLAHLDLGADAASLHDPRVPERPWGGPLLEAWDAAPGRLRVQAIALACDTVPTLLRTLRQADLRGLDDEAGRLLTERFADAIEAEADTDGPWRLSATPAQVQAVHDTAGPMLERLRSHMWAQRGQAPPPLQVLHVAALGGRARATTRDGVRRVATSLDRPVEHVALQVLHEEVHPITDPVVLARHPGVARHTRVGSEGFELHADLEQTAVDATQALLEALEPRWLDAFERWRRRFGMVSAAAGRSPVTVQSAHAHSSS